jgi:Flp pilus assembly CpaF family ATPase
MDPVWTVLGEIRGNEALTLIESFISHPGMATIHAKSCHAALIKLKMKIGESVNIRPEIIDQMITNAVDIVIFIKQIHNTKRVMEIAEVLAAPAVDSQYRLNTLLKFKSSQDGETFSILNKPTFLAELEDIGISMPEFWR